MPKSLTSMKKAQLKAQITRLAKQLGLTQATIAQYQQRVGALTNAQLRDVIVDLRGQLDRKKKQQAQKPKRRSSSGRKSGGRRTSTKVPKAKKLRAERIVRAIASNKVAVRQGVSKPSQAKGANARERYDAFLALYKGVQTGRKGSSKPKGPTLLETYEAIGGRGKKWPYYLSRGYTVKSFTVGGGRSGPGLIRAIPGKGAKPFSELSERDQQAVIKFLNGPGKALRSVGARKQTSYQQIASVAKKKARRSSGRKAAGSSYRW